MHARLAKWLEFPRVRWLGLVLGVGLGLPTLTLGAVLDDYVHLAAVRGLWSVASRWTLFDFAPGDAAKLEPFIVRGPYPWWSLPELKFRFWRPLSSLLINLDDALFGDHFALYHLHSLLWYAALLLAAAAIYRRALPGFLAGLAFLVFAVDDAHWMPVGWLANRNALVAAAPALFGLAAHLRWREEGWRPGLPLSLLGYAVGLSGGEAALAVMAYLGSYELFGAPGAGASRLKALAPAALLGLAYVAVYKAAGSGAYGSALYVDPATSPLAFATVAPARIAALCAGLLLHFPVDAWMLGDAAKVLIVSLGLAGLALFAWLARAAWPALAADERRALRWLIPGALLAMVPVAATFPAGRLLLIPSFGAAGAVAVLLRALWSAPARAPRWLARVVLVLHLPLAALNWGTQFVVFRGVAQRMADVARTLPVDDARLPDQQVVFVNAPDFPVALYPALVRFLEGHPKPAAWQVLSIAPLEHRLTRTGERSFELAFAGGAMLDATFEQLFRSDAFPLDPGHEVALYRGRVRVLDAVRGHPTRLGFSFDVPLDDPSLVLLVWTDGGTRVLRPPPIGEQLVLPYFPGPFEAL